MPLPVLYSFRRCPYAIRARIAVEVSGVRVELREILLRDKPQEFLAASPSATVPCLVETDGVSIDESLDVMLWALEKNDPEHLLQPEIGTLEEMLVLIERMDGNFKCHLDRYKYAPKEDTEVRERHRTAAIEELQVLEGKLERDKFLFGKRLSLADLAIAPFVRQFANVDADWFASTRIQNVQNWLDAFVNSDIFLAVMDKRPVWQPGTTGEEFPKKAA